MATLVNLKHFREARALSQRELARLSGLAHDTVGQLERGEREARPSTVRMIADVLEVKPSALWMKNTEGDAEKPDIPQRRLSEDLLSGIISFDDVIEEYHRGTYKPYAALGGLTPLLESRLSSDNPKDIAEVAAISLAQAQLLLRDVQGEMPQLFQSLESDAFSYIRQVLDDAGYFEGDSASSRDSVMEIRESMIKQRDGLTKLLNTMFSHIYMLLNIHLQADDSLLKSLAMDEANKDSAALTSPRKATGSPWYRTYTLPDLAYRLSDRQKKVLVTVSQCKEAGPSTVADKLDISVSTAYRDLAALEEQGFVIASEAGKRIVTEYGEEVIEVIRKDNLISAMHEEDIQEGSGQDSHE
jgi:transcriptional regulator with XRE-family HTH domain/DNA-binding MarR family transcriptional regulator